MILKNNLIPAVGERNTTRYIRADPDNPASFECADTPLVVLCPRYSPHLRTAGNIAGKQLLTTPRLADRDDRDDAVSPTIGCKSITNPFHESGVGRPNPYAASGTTDDRGQIVVAQTILDQKPVNPAKPAVLIEPKARQATISCDPVLSIVSQTNVSNPVSGKPLSGGDMAFDDLSPRRGERIELKKSMSGSGPEAPGTILIDP